MAVLKHIFRMRMDLSFRIFMHGRRSLLSNLVPLLCFHCPFTNVSWIGSNAVITLIFAEYLNRIFWDISGAEVSPDDIPQWAIKLTAIGALVVVTIICVAARKLGSRAAVVFTTVKVGSVFDLYDLDI